MRTIVKTARRSKSKIVVPTDFFPGSTFAMTYALALAKTNKTMVVAVHAVDPFEYNFGPEGLALLKEARGMGPGTRKDVSMVEGEQVPQLRNKRDRR